MKYQRGTLVFDKNELKGGCFVVDMTSIKVTDLEAGMGKLKLEGHLKADDFFGTDKFTTTCLYINKVGAKGNRVYIVTAVMTIKVITNPVTFEITVKEIPPLQLRYPKKTYKK
ncbi:MAG: polyisoprenoid-binding protein YceI [Patiriisocius sp.]|jgi:polyisoprenoid-binding protein YceI